ncbi:MAG TPA: DUF998 domain-containing protein [Ktedonosporobacter sp.]|nr:DUF998 domain-containing protein [Ktedonosporobacter sp.]
MKSQNGVLVKRFALGSLVGVLIFVILVMVLHVVNPQMSPLSVPVSTYVTGYDGFLMTMAFIARGLGELLLVAGLALGTTRSNPQGMTYGPGSWTGLVLLALATVCSFLVAIFPGMVAPFVSGGFQNTGALLIHAVGALIGFSSLALSALFWSRGLRKDPRWRSSSAVSLLLGLLMLLSLVGFLVTLKGFAGLTERVLEVFIVCWLSFMAWRLFALNSSQPLSAL